MKKNIDVFFIVDCSKMAEDYIDNIDTFLRAMVNSMIISRFLQNHNIYVNIFSFGSKFSKNSNIIMIDKPLKKIDDVDIRISHCGGAADPDAALRAAVSHGVARYDEWILMGEKAERPVFFFLSGGNFESVDGNAAKKNIIEQRYRITAEMIRELTADKKIRLYVCAIDTYNKAADSSTLALMLTDEKKQLIKMFSSFMYSASERFVKILSDF